MDGFWFRIFKNKGVCFGWVSLLLKCFCSLDLILFGKTFNSKALLLANQDISTTRGRISLFSLRQAYYTPKKINQSKIKFKNPTPTKLNYSKLMF